MASDQRAYGRMSRPIIKESASQYFQETTHTTRSPINFSTELIINAKLATSVNPPKGQMRLVGGALGLWNSWWVVWSNSTS